MEPFLGPDRFKVEKARGGPMATERNEGSSRKPPRSPEASGIADLKNHVVQIETLQLYTFIFIGVLFAIERVPPFAGNEFLLLLVVSVFFVGLRLVVHVTNPKSSMRSRLTWAAVVGGTTGTVLGAVADVASGGLTLGQGTLAGWAAGAAAGAALGDRIEGWGKDMVERGEAFAYLHQHRRRAPHLADPGAVDAALEHHIPSYDINQDGRRWYAKEDLRKFVRNGPVGPANGPEGSP
jgi:hypothetical protein